MAAMISVPTGLISALPETDPVLIGNRDTDPEQAGPIRPQVTADRSPAYFFSPASTRRVICHC